MAGLTARLGNVESRLGRIQLGAVPALLLVSLVGTLTSTGTIVKNLFRTLRGTLTSVGSPESLVTNEEPAVYGMITSSQSLDEAVYVIRPTIQSENAPPS